MLSRVMCQLTIASLFVTHDVVKHIKWQSGVPRHVREEIRTRTNREGRTRGRFYNRNTKSKDVPHQKPGNINLSPGSATDSQKWYQRGYFGRVHSRATRIVPHFLRVRSASRFTMHTICSDFTWNELERCSDLVAVGSRSTLKL
jgi:hypothetical protein